MFEPEVVKKDFPILKREVNGKPIVYLDSGATSQKPKAVIEAVSHYYETSNANVHRGAHTLGDESTELLKKSRQRVAEFVGGRAEEVVFVRNTTEAINLVAYAWGLDNLQEGDVVLSTEMEHHSNLVPWQEVARRTGAKVELVRVTKDGLLDQDDYKEKLKLKPKLVALVHVSNALGTINPVDVMSKQARRIGAKVILDGAQAVPHCAVDVDALNCDFYAFSGHKMLGPMGIGVLWGRKELLSKMSPFLSGGGMISEVNKDHSRWIDVPEKFEAGTPNVAGAVGLAAAIEYLCRVSPIGMFGVREHDYEVTQYALERLKQLKYVRVLGPDNPEIRTGSVSFVYEGVHAHDVATVLDSVGVMVRSGHHCTMVLHDKLRVSASIRASFNVYTTKEDIDRLIAGLEQVKATFGK